MSFLRLLNQIDADNLESEARDKFLSRKDALGKMGNWSKKLALSSLPLGALAAFSTPAKAQSTDDIIGVLNFALTLEYLEATYYQMALDSGVVQNMPGANIAGAHVTPTFQDIAKNETQHVNFLVETIGKLGGTPVGPLGEDDFDFTAGGNFQPFSDYPTFLLIAQAFEDTGVRAYKGQAGNVKSSDVVLTAALQIHSVEARHASVVRRIREIQGWIPQNQPDAPDAIAAVYAGEANTRHAGVEVPSVTSVSAEAITEAWDEPLPKDKVLEIAGLFLA